LQDSGRCRASEFVVLARSPEDGGVMQGREAPNAVRAALRDADGIRQAGQGDEFRSTALRCASRFRVP